MASREGTSHGRVIVDCELSLREHLSLGKIVPAMVKKKLLNRTAGKILLKKDDMGLFIDTVLKKSTPEQFGGFLTIIREMEEEPSSEMNYRPLMKVLSLQLKNMKPKQASLQKIVSDFIEAADKEFKISSQLPSTSTTSATTSLDGSSTNVIQSTTTQSSLALAATASSTSSIVEGCKTLAVTNRVSDTDSRSVDDSGAPKSQAAIALKGRRPFPFPRGYLSGCKSRSFTRAGGMLYSPEHGVTVIIPEGAIPASVDNFMLGVYVYMRGPFSLPENAQLCSPIVWFHHQPKFKFEAGVTIKIPHCAIVAAVQPKSCSTGALASLTEEDDSLRVVTVEEGMDEGVATQYYALTRRLPADFSDGYHAIFVVRHFSPHTVVKCGSSQQQSPTRKRLGSNESSGIRKRTYSNSSSVASNLPCKGQTTTKDLQKSGSLEDDLYSMKQAKSRKEGGTKAQDGMKFCIARCMPVDRSTGNWDVNFLISHCHSTGISAMHRYAKELHEGRSMDVTKRKFYFTEDVMEFLPESWTSSANCWTVRATETNVLSMEDIIMELPSPSPLPSEECMDQSRSEELDCYYPPRLTYAVQAASQSFPPAEQLDCTIQVRGALEANKGKALFFNIRSKTSPHHRNDVYRSRQLFTVPYLYSSSETCNADILQAISQRDRSFSLSLSDPNHTKFLIDISLQLTGRDHPEKLGLALHLEHYQIEQVQNESLDDISWQVYSILREWLAGNSGATTLGALKDALSNIEVTDINISEPGNDASNQDVSLISTSLDLIPITELQVIEDFFVNLSEKLQYCWRKVGSLMGIPKRFLDVQAKENDTLHEQAYQMLWNWQRKNWSRDTTHGVVFKAVQRLFKHHPGIVNDAWAYCVHHLEKYSYYTVSPETAPVTLR